MKKYYNESPNLMLWKGKFNNCFKKEIYLFFFISRKLIHQKINSNKAMHDNSKVKNDEYKVVIKD